MREVEDEDAANKDSSGKKNTAPRVIIGNDLIKDVTKEWKGSSKFQEQYQKVTSAFNSSVNKA